MKKFLILLACLVSSVGLIQAQEQGQGYRGFADIGYGIGIGNYEFGRISVETSHGYQICHYLYAGAGIGFQFSQKAHYGDLPIYLDERESKVDIPVFANLHSQLLKSKFSPFLDAKAGCYVNNNGGLYVLISAGLRIATTQRQAVNISVGYGLQQLEFETFDRFIGSTLNYTRSPNKLDCEVITLKIGYEF